MSAFPFKVLEYLFHTPTHCPSFTGALPLSCLVVCYITGLLHQLYGPCRSRPDCTFERLGIPGMTSRDNQHLHHTNRYPKKTLPNNSTVEFSFGRLGFSILIQGRLDAERREHTSDDKVQGPETKVSARTGPRGDEYDCSPPWGVEEYHSPPPRSEYPILGIVYQGV